jgi:hypothetical protein
MQKIAHHTVCRKYYWTLESFDPIPIHSPVLKAPRSLMNWIKRMMIYGYPSPNFPLFFKPVLKNGCGKKGLHFARSAGFPPIFAS